MGNNIVSCDNCRKPGHCCKGFVISMVLNKSSWRDEAKAVLTRNNMDFFVPIEAVKTIHTGDGVAVRCDCTRLGEDGRCTDYANRPRACMMYEPGQDQLCFEYAGELVPDDQRPVHFEWFDEEQESESNNQEGVSK
jgi:Fe-S-cluster containining protein